MLQLVTINIGGARHTHLDAPDPARVVRELCARLPIDAALPTVIAMQEATQVWESPDAPPLDTAALFAAELGTQYRSYFACEMDSDLHPQRISWNHPVFRGVYRACEGNAIVTNLPLAGWSWNAGQPGQPGYGLATPISTQISRATLYSTGGRDTQPRNALVASLQTPTTPIYLIATHLATLTGEQRRDLDHPNSQRASAERQYQVENLIGLHAQLRAAERAHSEPPRPILLAGDFNAQPHSPEMRALTPPFEYLPPQTAQTWTHIKHEIAIDHIFVDDPAGCLGALLDCGVQVDPVIRQFTDHYPVIARFSLSIP